MKIISHKILAKNIYFSFFFWWNGIFTYLIAKNFYYFERSFYNNVYKIIDKEGNVCKIFSNLLLLYHLSFFLSLIPSKLFQIFHIATQLQYSDLVNLIIFFFIFEIYSIVIKRTIVVNTAILDDKTIPFLGLMNDEVVVVITEKDPIIFSVIFYNTLFL